MSWLLLLLFNTNHDGRCYGTPANGLSGKRRETPTVDMDLTPSTCDSVHEMHLSRESSPEAKTVIEQSFLPQALAHSPSDVFVVKALATAPAGGTIKYRVYCDPDATLAVLRDTLQNDEDNIMSVDDRFQQGDFRVGKSAEPHIKWRDILQVR